jgi:hypothetical protein
MFQPALWSFLGDTYAMKMLVVTLYLAAVAISSSLPAEIDYPALWEAATPFPAFLENVTARQEQWRSRFANAAVDANSLNEARALPGRRRILAVAEDRCSDSAWAVPYIAKLAAAVPEKLEVRVIGPKQGQAIQAAHLTPDGRMATPTIVVLDEQSRFIGAWIERPAELQKHYLEKKPTVSRQDLYDYVNGWYTQDAGQTTIREVLSIMRREPPEVK